VGGDLTLLITASFLPWEIFEVIRKVTYVRVSLLVVNTLVLLYLLKLVTRRGRNSDGSSDELVEPK
jgi:uncharacterized membrane protein (DUF2068 family)